MKRIPELIVFWALSSFLCASAADPPAPAERALTTEEKAVADLANAYEAAFNKNDSKALAAHFTEDAEWVDAEGRVVSGRAGIEKALRESFAAQKGRKLDLRVESVRPLTADVLAEKGTSVITAPDATTTINSYTAVHVKRDTKWLISQITETGTPLAGNARDNLRVLEWLVGVWDDDSAGVTVRTTVKWAQSGNFLTRTFKAAREGADETEGTEVIGWDPKAGKIRSWIFDNKGGFGESLWTQEGRRWLIQARLTSPDGRESTAQHTLTHVSDDKCTWSSANREIDGELLPNIDPVEMVRVKNP